MVPRGLREDFQIKESGNETEASFEWRSEAKRTEHAADYPEPPRLVAGLARQGTDGVNTKGLRGSLQTNHVC